jgi:hypothetical protein
MIVAPKYGAELGFSNAKIYQSQHFYDVIVGELKCYTELFHYVVIAHFLFYWLHKIRQ